MCANDFTFCELVSKRQTKSESRTRTESWNSKIGGTKLKLKEEGLESCEPSLTVTVTVTVTVVVITIIIPTNNFLGGKKNHQKSWKKEW